MTLIATNNPRAAARTIMTLALLRRSDGVSAQPWARMCPVSEPEFSTALTRIAIVAKPGPSPLP